jgi:hypothetical protein
MGRSMIRVALARLLVVFALGAASLVHASEPTLRTDRFRVVYEPPGDPAHAALYDLLREKHTLERFREFLSFIRLPRTLTLKVAGCNGDDNAWYDPEDRTITVCYEYLAGVARVAPKAATPEGVTPENAVLGPLLEVFLHEIGHALFDQLHIPILGREEDAADQFAAIVLLHLSPATARDTVVGVAWMYGTEAKAAQLTTSHLANVHGLAGQRFYNLLCLAYGAEPALFQDLVDKQVLPQGRAETCEDEYRQVAYAVRTLMGRYVDVGVREKVLAKEWVGGKVRRKTSTDLVPK